MQKSREDVEYVCAVGQRMRAVRKARKLSQIKLAGLANVDSTTISEIERGIGNPTLITIVKIARALERSCADFFPANA